MARYNDKGNGGRPKGYIPDSDVIKRRVQRYKENRDAGKHVSPNWVGRNRRREE